MPLPPPPPPRVTQGRQVARWGAPPPQQKGGGGGGAGGPPEGPAAAGGLLRPSRAGVERPVHAVAPRARVGGGGVIRAPGTERRVQGLVPVHREPTCRAPTRGLRLRHRRLPLRLRLLGGPGLLHVVFARPVAVQPALEASPRGACLSGLRGLLSGWEFAFFDPEGRPQGGPRAVGQRSCLL